jgi:hypothetical protein
MLESWRMLKGFFLDLKARFAVLIYRSRQKEHHDQNIRKLLAKRTCYGNTEERALSSLMWDV